MVTPNWRWDQSPLPVDTLQPPPTPPLEWAYLAPQWPTDEVGIIDAYGADLGLDEFAKDITALQPHCAVVATAPSLLYWRCPPLTVRAVAESVAAIRKATDAWIILVGPHPTHSPLWTLRSSGADAAFRGAPERDLVSYLLSRSEDGSSPYVETGAGCSSVSVLIADELPLASFDAVDWSIEYVPHMWGVTETEIQALGLSGQSAALEASRGCPWACSYCAKAPVRDDFGRRSVKLVEQELSELKRLGVGYVFFIDETFNMRGKHTEHVLDLVESSGVKFGFQGRADLVTEESARRLAEAGCVYAELGIDVASSELSVSIDRKQNVERAEAGVLAAKDHIPVTRFNRINLSTRDYSVRLGLPNEADWDYPADPAYPYPGAPLGEMLMRLHGREQFDWDFAQRYAWWLRFEVYLQRHRPHLPGEVVDNLQERFLNISPESATAVAEILEPLVLDEEFLVANKYFEGVGNGVRIHHPGP